MDIDYLLWLQDLREGLPAFVTDFFVHVSAFVLSPVIILIPCVVYWCVAKREGTKVALSFALGSIVCMLAKAIACINRPWIRSSAVHPVEAALPEATGYSFPSGHTQTATSIIGSIGWLFRTRSRVLAICCWVLVALVGLSRNVLGVHTPQDVLVGLALGIASIAAASWLVEWVDIGTGRDRVVALVSVLVTVGIVAFVLLKPYPTEYVDGNLLVDPSEMKADVLKSAGMFLGAMLGWYLERALVGFDTEVSPRAKGIRVIVGVVVVLAARFLVPLPLKPFLSPMWVEFVKNMLTVFSALFVAPWVFKRVELRFGV